MYRHFFVFLFSTCSIQHTYLLCSERNVITNTFLLPSNLYKSYKLVHRFFPTPLGSIFALFRGLVALFKMADRFPSFGSYFAWICARFSPSLKLNIWLPSSYLKKGKVSSLGEKFPAPNYENLIQNRLLREDNLRRRECEDHFLDSFVTQAEIEGFVVALDGNLQRTYGRL